VLTILESYSATNNFASWLACFIENALLLVCCEFFIQASIFHFDCQFLFALVQASAKANARLV
jgi:hypothetical protein